ncbi:MAG: tetratricopeptide repeat protein [Pseudomonadota bacterium]
MTANSRTFRISACIGIALFTAISVRADGIAAFERGDHEQARTELAAQLKTNANDGQAQYYYARTLLALGDNDGAMDAFDRAADLNPENADVHYWRGRVYGTAAANANIMQAGKLARAARKSFEKALEIDESHHGALVGMVEFKRQAPRIVGGSKRDALEYAERLEKIDAVEGAVRKADVLRSMRKEDEADAVMSTLLAQRPDDPQVRLRLGFNRLGADDYEGAIDHVQIASAAPLATASDAQKESIYSAWYQLGRSHVFAKKPSDEAAAALQRYIDEVAPNSDLPGKDWAHFRLGELKAINGNADAANQHFQIALDSTNDKELRKRVNAKLK